MMTNGLYSSKTPEWETPQGLFDDLDNEFNFIIDVCANKKNAKCINYFTKEVDGLEQNWEMVDGWKWMNPPYGREIAKWVEKASKHQTVCLLPARTDTKWFHDYIYNKDNAEIRFIKGRLKFSNSKNSAPFPSMVVIFK